ncbi:MAG TPA: hypothetical protein VFT74_21490, partial [Isosphaeraceae bacterium]|nr:hypothetical protein [Isosphaeraceae bacterium]
MKRLIALRSIGAGLMAIGLLSSSGATLAQNPPQGDLFESEPDEAPKTATGENLKSHRRLTPEFLKRYKESLPSRPLPHLPPLPEGADRYFEPLAPGDAPPEPSTIEELMRRPPRADQEPLDSVSESERELRRIHERHIKELEEWRKKYLNAATEPGAGAVRPVPREPRVQSPPEPPREPEDLEVVRRQEVNPPTTVKAPEVGELMRAPGLEDACYHVLTPEQVRWLRKLPKHPTRPPDEEFID